MGIMDKTETHPSYAMMGFHRVNRSGSGTTLFGSSIKHSNMITLTIKRARLHRGLGRDWYSGGKQLIEVTMSQSQFAEAITAMNYGDGVPVTLTWFDGEYIEDTPFEDKRQQFEDEFREDMEGVARRVDNTIEKVTELFSKQSVGKKDREKILESLQSLKQQLESNMPFVATSFNEQMDKTVKEAKGEVEAFVQNKMNNIARAALAESIEDIKQIQSPIDFE